MKRRSAMGSLVGLGALAAGLAARGAAADGDAPALKPPVKGRIPVAVLIGPGATVIDFAGPWEVFQDVHVESRGQSMDEQMPFEPFTVSEKGDPIEASAGLRLLPNYTFADCPAPRVLLMGAQGGQTPKVIDWVRATAPKTDLTMSVCTGAFLLAKTGLLDGRQATTHHDFYARFEKEFPKITLRRSLRFVESAPNLATAGGLTSGIDLALRVVERYFGREVAAATAGYMEYQGTGWRT
jgi:transcriptional regulator GlxA family with amidase domain